MTPESVRSRLRATLALALKRQDRLALAAIRSVISAIDNAEAVDLPDAPPPAGSPIAGSIPGLGRGEAPRRRLTATDLERIVKTELEDREIAAVQYERTGQTEGANRLRAEITIIRTALQLTE